MKINFILISILYLISSSCTDVIDFDLKQESENIVIIGSINTKPGPYTVTISNSIGFYDEFLGAQNSISGASVIISSDEGEEEILSNIGPGVYQTRSIRGKVGVSYTLSVTTLEGEVYTATTEKIKASPPIENIFFKEIDRVEKNYLNVPFTIKYVEVFIETFDIPNEDNYYSWIWNGTHRFKSPFELINTPCDAPCSICWMISNDNNDLIILDDKLLTSDNAITQKIVELLVNSTTFEDKYHISVEQQSMSKTAYKFWESVKKQANASTLFATPSVLIESNIKNINNPDKLIYGNFSAYGVSEISFFIDKSEISDIPFDLFQFVGDCSKKFGATNQKPDYWD